MGSTRLPKKSIMKINDDTLLGYLIKRVRCVEALDSIIVATSNKQRDCKIGKIAEKHNVNVFRGSEGDVLDRFVKSARFVNANLIVRITADNPFTDPQIMTTLIRSQEKKKVDYTWMKGLPVGIGSEVISMSALEKAAGLAIVPYDREHVTSFIKCKPQLFKINILEAPREFNYPDYRLTVDYPEDYQLVRKIHKCLNSNEQFLSLKKIVQFLKENPTIAKINRREEA
jgi:spore coat polysaccharide biosynthesis protein SpsF